MQDDRNRETELENHKRNCLANYMMNKMTLERRRKLLSKWQSQGKDFFVTDMKERLLKVSEQLRSETS